MRRNRTGFGAVGRSVSVWSHGCSVSGSGLGKLGQDVIEE